MIKIAWPAPHPSSALFSSRSITTSKNLSLSLSLSPCLLRLCPQPRRTFWSPPVLPVPPDRPRSHRIRTHTRMYACACTLTRSVAQVPESRAECQIVPSQALHAAPLRIEQVSRISCSRPTTSTHHHGPSLPQRLQLLHATPNQVHGSSGWITPARSKAFFEVCG